MEVENQVKKRLMAKACQLPPLITTQTELNAFIVGSEHPNFIGSKSIIAACIHLNSHGINEQQEFRNKIIVVPQADPGYDWLFGQGIVGLVTLYGGVNSHMAIRAAEFGLPAAIGVGEQRYRALREAEILEISPADEVLRVVR